MICIGIESTAHTFGVGIVDNSGKILANEKSVFTTENAGIHPRKAAEHHKLIYDKIIEKAMKSAKIEFKDIDLVAFSQGPGLGACLRIGANAARSLSIFLKKPLIGVNHCIAHIEIGKLYSGFKDPITLYVSGANTQILALASGKYRVFGETLDIGVGNFLDSFGRTLGIGFPAGPEIEKLAKKGKNYIKLPYTIKGMDFAFSGLQTKLNNISKKHSKQNLCYSAQETAFSELVEATERAISHIGKKEVLLTGGVAANSRLKEMMEIMCRKRNIKFSAVPPSLAGDNGTMIAWQGILEHKAGKKTRLIKSGIKQHWRIDEVNVVW